MTWCPMLCPMVLLTGLLLLRTRVASAVTEDAMLNQCSELKAQEHLDLNEVMGKWYVVQIIEHKIDSRYGADSGGGGTPGTLRVVLNTCPIVKLRSVEPPRGGSTRDGPPRIRLLWEENIGTLEYTFWVSNNRGPGVWNSDIIQNGSLANEPTYKQFVGTVHVMKAVASHMVLTFCSRNTDGQKFSILVGREHRLPKTDLNGVRKLLERRNLKLPTIRESCANGGASLARLDTQLATFGLLATLALVLLRQTVN